MSQQKPVGTTGLNFTPTLHHDTYPAIDPTKASFDGRYIFITGASKGIGRAAAVAYAKAGAAGIGLGARSDTSAVEKDVKNAAVEAGKKAPTVLKIKLDVSSRQSVEDAAKTVQDSFGSLDVLVNNAGYLEKFLPMMDSDPDEWWKTWETNIRGTYLMTRSFLPLLLKGSGKTILNVSSGGAHVVFPGASAYQTTKMAILRLSEFTNTDYGKQGIVAFSIHPGGVRTELAGGMPQHMRDMLLIDTPELGANTMVYLTHERQEWLRGRYVSAQWDMDELFARKDEIVEKDLLKVRMAVE
ncbi:MAG: hypothetical protein Q9212_007244 [Teloschistes hypoglaucus]